MAKRRGIDLSFVEKEDTRELMRLHSDVSADELIEIIEPLAHEHCGGDFSKITVSANAEAHVKTLYNHTSVEIEELHISLDFLRKETDEEAARRFIYDFDRMRGK
jgi:hypothetical protein